MSEQVGMSEGDIGPGEWLTVKAHRRNGQERIQNYPTREQVAHVS